MSMIGLELIDEAGRRREVKINALERMLKLVPTQCSVPSDGTPVEVVRSVDGDRNAGLYPCSLSVSRDSPCADCTYTLNHAIWPSVRALATELIDYVHDPHHLAQVIDRNVARLDASSYEQRRIRELTKAFSNA